LPSYVGQTSVQCHLLCPSHTVCINCGETILPGVPSGDAFQSAFSGHRRVSVSGKSRLIAGSSQDWLPRDLCRIAPGRKVSGIGLKSAPTAQDQGSPGLLAQSERYWVSLSLSYRFARQRRLRGMGRLTTRSGGRLSQADTDLSGIGLSRISRRNDQPHASRQVSGATGESAGATSRFASLSRAAWSRPMPTPG